MNLKNVCINLKNPSSLRSENPILYSRMQLERDGESAQSV